MSIPIGPTWEAVGPFPSGMREHPFLASPLHAWPPRDGTHPDIDFAIRLYGEGDWPSAYPTGGRAGWAQFKASDDGVLAVAFPEVNWSQLRADHGWASLQFRAELRSGVTIPPTAGRDTTRVCVDVLQAAEYAFVPANTPRGARTAPPVWYTGDVYGLGATPNGKRGTEAGKVSNFARAIALPPGEYVLLVRALYECRMFGDPGDAPPTIQVTVKIQLDEPGDDDGAVIFPGLGFVPDVVDGWLMGDWASVGVRVPPGGDAVTVTVDSGCGGVRFTTQRGHGVRIAPGQTRVVAIRITQTDSTDADKFKVALRVTDAAERERTLTWEPTFTHVANDKPFRMTFASPSLPRPPAGYPSLVPALVSLAVIVPPTTPNPPRRPVMLALHGAGVEVTDQFWVEAVPVTGDMWAVLPSGRNEWGEDWHGGSMEDCWAARDALPVVLNKINKAVSHDTVLVGHSNGGQGAWHLAARYPDRIVGVLVFAGYLKIQDYVPYTQSTSYNYADPALIGILHSALTPYNNDLYASNLASIPVLAVHGGDDDNVPPRHGRAHCAIIQAWARKCADVEYVEVPHKGHWWEGGFAIEPITRWIARLPPKREWDSVRRAGYSLATANPDESGGKAGIRIVELAMPGRLARLDVNMPQWGRDGDGGLDLHGTNIHRIEVIGYEAGVDDTEADKTTTRSLVYQDGAWAEEGDSSSNAPRRPLPIRKYGPVMRLLASACPVTLVVPSHGSGYLRDLALDYAQDLLLYHRLDSVLLQDEDALRAVAGDTLGPGNVVVFGAPHENRFARWMIAQERTPVRFPTRGVLTVDGRIVYEPGAGIIALHPHPTHDNSLAVLIAGNDAAGATAAARLLPLRTGVTVPDWAVVTARCSWQGAGGLAGAGFWNGQWGWSEGISWMDRE